ncbi:unnamed protein product [Paramecium octaurelia]|uniref:Protein kish n=1 Tax=Paramecium octaurelia TaxID=43137 RepID=A0A8S1SX36_PAROT|nr:unnamed protein product [Paramecium octaurelia]
MFGIFNFSTMIVILLLVICTSTYVRQMKPDLINSHRHGFRGFFRRSAVIGDRLSPLVSGLCFIMGAYVLLLR